MKKILFCASLGVMLITVTGCNHSQEALSTEVKEVYTLEASEEEQVEDVTISNVATSEKIEEISEEASEEIQEEYNTAIENIEFVDETNSLEEERIYTYLNSIYKYNEDVMKAIYCYNSDIDEVSYVNEIQSYFLPDEGPVHIGINYYKKYGERTLYYFNSAAERTNSFKNLKINSVRLIERNTYFSRYEVKGYAVVDWEDDILGKGEYEIEFKEILADVVNYDEERDVYFGELKLATLEMNAFMQNGEVKLPYELLEFPLPEDLEPNSETWNEGDVIKMDKFEQ